MIAPKPQRLSSVEAASVPVVAVTAWQMLFEHARPEAGQTVMILGAAGNVGAYAVQLAANARFHVKNTAHVQLRAAAAYVGQAKQGGLIDATQDGREVIYRLTELGS